MAWQCPHCNHTLEKLNYGVDTNQREYGTAYLTDEKPETTEDRNNSNEMIEDWNQDDNGDSEWSEDPSYSCHECNEELELSDLIWIEEEKITIEKIEPEKTTEPEETLHNIIHPEKSLLDERENRKRVFDATIICKKCNHVFINENDQYTDMHGISSNENNSCECPKCSEMNSTKEFQELLKKGYFNNINPKQYARKKNKSKLLGTLG